MIKITAPTMAAHQYQLERMERALPQATMDALNWTAYNLRERLQDEMRSVFERPTRHTLNSLRVDRAKPTKLQAVVRMDDEYTGQAAPATVWLAPNIFARPRRMKGYEKNLKARGILPSGQFAIPGKGLRRNADGTVNRGHLNQLLSGLGASEHAAGWSSNATRSARSVAKGNRRAFFVMRRNRRPIAIAERRGKRLDIVLAFARPPNYRQRFDFYGVAEGYAERELPRMFDRAIQRRLK